MTTQEQEQHIIVLIEPSAPSLQIVLKSFVYSDIKDNENFNTNKLSRQELLKNIVNYYSKRGASIEDIMSAISSSILELQL
jgi:hypothetical protein